MQVYIGIDWADAHHEVHVLNERGASIAKFSIAHSLAGFEQLGVPPAACWVGLETAHNLLIDYLWDHGYQQIYGLPPARIPLERPKRHASGAYDDPSDAGLIAQQLRSDPSAFCPWQPDGVLVRQMRSLSAWGCISPPRPRAPATA